MTFTNEPDLIKVPLSLYNECLIVHSNALLLRLLDIYNETTYYCLSVNVYFCVLVFRASKLIVYTDNLIFVI